MRSMMFILLVGLLMGCSKVESTSSHKEHLCFKLGRGMLAVSIPCSEDPNEIGHE